VLALIPSVFDWSIISYEIIQVIVAFIAVMLAIKWKKNDFIAGLIFLLLYTILDAIDVFIFTVSQGIYVDFAQFGIILLAIIFFIIGMNPSWVHKRASVWTHP
jgi:hypothetical protein